MSRPCVEKAALEAGVSIDILTTLADIYGGPYGLPDEAPHNEMVVLKPGTDRESPEAKLWERHLWLKWRGQEDRRRGIS